jgi:very-short-patch-repair endonuclease
MIRNQKSTQTKLSLAKSFRREMTMAERCFWNACRKHQIGGLHFRRQQVIQGFIADFYCSKLKLVIEIDGGIHELQKDYDNLRDHIINQYGIKVLRFSNDEVINHMDKVINNILSTPPCPPLEGRD